MFLFLVPLKDELEDAFAFEKTLWLLPFEVQKKVIKKKFHKDAKLVLSNLLLQKFILNLNVGDHELKFGKFGKPFVEGIQFSMSNEIDVCAMAVGKNELGLDLSRSRNESLDEISGVLCAAEVLFIEEFNRGDRDDRGNGNNEGIWSPRDPFQWIWAMKEAYGKYTGYGINYDLQSVRFGLPLKPVSVNLRSNKLYDTDTFTPKECQWYTTSIYINNEIQDLDIYLIEIDNVVACTIGEGIKIENIYYIDVNLMIKEITAGNLYKQEK